MKIFLTLLSFVSILSLLQAQPGTLDKSYGTNGSTYNPVSGTFINSSAIQADDKVIVSGLNADGSFILIRYNTDGAIDNSFGKEGKVSTLFKQYDQGDGWINVQVQPDGKIVAAGTNYTIEDNNYPPYNADITLARFTAAGTPDSSFGTNGIVITDFGEYEAVSAIALQRDGKIVLTGTYSLQGIGNDSKVITVRYNADGSLDNSFGGKGYVIYPGSGVDNIHAIAVQDDGKIVVGGDYQISRYFMLIRYLPDGELDDSFGSNGMVKTKIAEGGVPSDESVNSLAIDKQQRILAAGTCLNTAMSVVRYNRDGSIDNTFDEDGKKIIQLSETFTQAKTVLLLKDERILLTGDVSGDINGNLALVCLKAEGSFDSSFGIDGKTISDFNLDENCANTVLQRDGKIIVASTYQSNDFFSYVLARYNGYNDNKQPLSIRIKRWLQHHGISWQVGNNFRYYAVQRSSDGITYKEVTKLGNSSSNYEDAAPLTGNTYYRLAAIAKDGSRTYSNTVLIDESSQVRMFPNPVKDNLQLQGLATGGKTAVSVVDLQGNVRTTATAGGRGYSVNTAHLTRGNYLLKMQHNGTTTTQAFVKE